MRLRRAFKITGIVVGVLALIGIGAAIFLDRAMRSDPFLPLFVDNCAVCHGESFEGTAQGPALVGRPLTNGETVTEIAQSIAAGFPERGMPGWSGVFDEGSIQSLAILVAEQRVNRQFTDFKVDKALEIPIGPIVSELATFRIEPVAADIDPYPFSIAPMPDGSILVTEKVQGLSIVAPDGARSEPVSGTPETSDYGVTVLGLDYGLGWLLDVAPHPDFAENGWIYLLHAELCVECQEGGDDVIPKTMSRLIRGRIRDGAWVDEEVIWSVPQELYTTLPDIGAGGRIAFSPDGYVFLSVGIKGGYYEGIQDLATPYGKIHRTIPTRCWRTRAVCSGRTASAAPRSTSLPRRWA